MTDGTPLPAALSGNIVERLIRIDEALIYLISGSLSYLVGREPLEQTGTLTPEVAKSALSDMFTVYFEETPSMTPVGATMMWHTVTPPANWLFCVGNLEQVAEWPELFALWGYKYGGSGAQFATPNLTDYSPMGAGGALVALDDYSGAATHTLTTAQIPAHSHDLKIGQAAGAGAHPHANNNQAAQSTAYEAVAAAGGGEAHNNLSPVFGAFFIVYAGKHVT